MLQFKCFFITTILQKEKSVCAKCIFIAGECHSYPEKTKNLNIKHFYKLDHQELALLLEIIKEISGYLVY